VCYLDKRCRVPWRPLIQHTVITGYNTDIHHHGVTYHVQTEDKGFGTKMIVSLVYCGGSILASKRSTYEELVPDINDLVELEEQLKRQHKLICAAIGAGRIDELKNLPHKDHLHHLVHHETHEAHLMNEAHLPETPDKVSVAGEETADLPSQPEEEESLVDSKNVVADFDGDDNFVSTAEPEIMYAPDAVTVVPEIAPQTIPVSNRLQIHLIDADELFGGDKKVLGIKVFRGNRDSGVSGVHLILKVTATAFDPLIYHSITNDDGLAQVNVELPHFNEGRATLVVRAMLAGEKTELRQPIEFG